MSIERTSQTEKGLRPLTLLFIFFTLIASLTLIIPAFARDVPLSTENIITNSFDTANSVYVADIDGNGTLDVLGSATAANTVAWWSNINGDGSAWTEVTIDDTFLGAEEVHAADVDGDGDLDVLGAGHLGGGFAWWQNSANSSIWTKTLISALDEAYSIQGVDIDQDGDIDAVGATYINRQIYWWENNDDIGTTWITHTVTLDSWGVRHVRVADIDSDGDPDILSVSVHADDISWWENLNGDGSSWTEHRLDDFFDQARSINASDIDGDGDLDIVGAAQAENRIVYWENLNGDGSTWAELTVTATFIGVRSVYPIDFDLDGDPDLIGAAFTANAVRWWENSNGDGSVWTEHQIDNTFGNAISAYAADLDQDGDPDFLAAAELDDSISWWENETIHSIALYPQLFEHTIATELDGSLFSWPTDIDQDGDPDVLATVYHEGNISWWENGDGIGQTWSENIIDSGLTQPFMAKPADIDEDGDLDVAAISGNEISWWENAGEGISWIKTNVDAVTNPLALTIADVDRDGDFDLISSDTVTNTNIIWWENQMNGAIWQAHIVGMVMFQIRSVNSVDVDGDGDVDILTGSDLGISLDWWENLDGVGLSWLQHNVAIEGFDHPHYVDSIDMDHDGDVDLFAAASISDELAWWENDDGSGLAWIKHTIDTFDGASSMQVMDLDYDGDLDVLGSALEADEFSWWENSGDAVTWTKHTLNNSSEGAASVAAVDMDRDGDLDLVGAGFAADNILWWENRGGQFSLATTDSSPTGMGAGEQAVLLTIEVIHNGRLGDSDLEIVALELRLEETVGDPLSNAEANAIIESLEVYLDDGSGIFDSGIDTLIVLTDTLNLVNGLLAIPFADSDPNVQVIFDMPQTYFVVANLTTDMETNPARNGVEAFVVTHMTESSSTAEDRDFDIPLQMAYSPNVSATVSLFGPTAVSLKSINTPPSSSLLLLGIIFILSLVFSWGYWHKRILAYGFQGKESRF